MLNVLIISCSPKKEKSNSYNLAKAFLKGFPKETNIQSLYLYDKNIEYCNACLYCITTGHFCPIKDDVLNIVRQTQKYDFVIWAIPHMGPLGYPSKMKAFFERCCNNKTSYFQQSSSEKNDISEKNILILSCGYPSKRSIEELKGIAESFKENFKSFGYLIIPEADLLTFYPEDRNTKDILRRIRI